MQAPEEAVEYLRCSLDEYFRDGNTEAFLSAIRTIYKERSVLNNLIDMTAVRWSVTDPYGNDYETPCHKI